MSEPLAHYQEIMERYGDLKVSFSSYYKYTFAFTGEGGNGEKIRAYYGGNADEIYRIDVDTKPVSIRSLEPCRITIVDANDVVLVHYDEF